MLIVLTKIIYYFLNISFLNVFSLILKIWSYVSILSLSLSLFLYLSTYLCLSLLFFLFSRSFSFHFSSEFHDRVRRFITTGERARREKDTGNIFNYA